MKSLRFYVCLSVIILVTSIVFADVPQLLSYQGVLTDSSGNPIADNVHAVKFRIYADSVSEVAFWESNGFVPIQTTEGKFSHVIGSTNILPDSLSNLNELWLGISVGLASELKPRMLLLKPSAMNKSTEKTETISIEKEIILEDDDIFNEFEKVEKPEAVPKSAKKVRIKTTGKTKTPTGGLLLKSGFDILGSHKVSGLGLSASEDVKTGFSLGAILYLMNSLGTARFGVGSELQVSREQQDFEGDFNFNSLFAILMVHPSIYNENVRPYATGRLGYNFFNGNSDYKGTGIAEADLEGGLHFGIGGGLVIDKILLIEILYAVNNGEATIFGESFDIKYSRATITIGLAFDFKNQ